MINIYRKLDSHFTQLVLKLISKLNGLYKKYKQQLYHIKFLSKYLNILSSVGKNTRLIRVLEQLILE